MKANRPLTEGVLRGNFLVFDKEADPSIGRPYMVMSRDSLGFFKIFRFDLSWRIDTSLDGCFAGCVGRAYSYLNYNAGESIFQGLSPLSQSAHLLPRGGWCRSKPNSLSLLVALIMHYVLYMPKTYVPLPSIMNVFCPMVISLNKQKIDSSHRLAHISSHEIPQMRLCALEAQSRYLLI